MSSNIDLHAVSPELFAMVSAAQADFASSPNPAELENAKAKYLGKTGSLTELLKGMAQLDVEAKKTRGASINLAKQAIESALNTAREAMAARALNEKLAAEAIDVTLPARGQGAGGLHPVMQTWARIEEIFRSIGFDVADGPEIEDDWHNFTALNNPENHPARSMQDTFYVTGATDRKSVV